MENCVLGFVEKPYKDIFLVLRDVVINHPDFDPQSKDIEVLENLLDQERFDDIIAYNSINILLNPQAYFAKSDAHEKKKEIARSRESKILASYIIKGILDTGDGTFKFPYKITRIDDAYIVLMFLDEEFLSQELIREKGKIFDKIKTISGKAFYFDIAHCYS